MSSNRQLIDGKGKSTILEDCLGRGLRKGTVRGTVSVTRSSSNYLGITNITEPPSVTQLCLVVEEIRFDGRLLTLWVSRLVYVFLLPRNGVGCFCRRQIYPEALKSLFEVVVLT